MQVTLNTIDDVLVYSSNKINLKACLHKSHHAMALEKSLYSIRPQHVISSLDEKPTWSPTWQVWMMLAKIVGIFLGWLLNVGIAEVEVGIWV
jgi:hypothetical protein